MRKSRVQAEPPGDRAPPVKSLGQLADAEAGCTRCPLYRDATQAVPGEPITMADGTRLVVTTHPSALLRIEDDAERHAAYRGLVADLKAAMAAHIRQAPHK